VARSIAQGTVIALIFLFVGVAGAAAFFGYLPNPGSPPSVYDDFRFSTPSNGFWHVNADGAAAKVTGSLITLHGAQIELDHRLQTDPHSTVVVARVRGWSFQKFALGIGGYHSSSVSVELDSDGVKCVRATDNGTKVDFMRVWKKPPAGQWLYLALVVQNPYPHPPKHLDVATEKGINLTCALYGSRGVLTSADRPTDPPASVHYPGIDEVYFRTWDTHNDYQLDWIYAGPSQGIPHSAHLRGRVPGLS